MHKTREEYKYDGAILELTELHHRIGTLETRIETLTAERAALVTALENARAVIIGYGHEKGMECPVVTGASVTCFCENTMEAQLEALVTALEEFGTHKFSCNTYKKPEAPGLCTCGLEAAFLAYTVSALAAVRVDKAQATTKE